ncbi:peptidase M16 [Neosynechococcus sphagnicola sy1]|uniref:Peptidase M16 n=2 Tax=Neosynechococcus TaxID=1501143 RepID=A0A098TSF7_9CYAN|nr:peptidase M16 [Neosynechococcus sphagnicola sy1]
MPSIQNRTIHRTVLANGLVVLVVENPVADIVAARIFVKAGSLWESRQQAGLSHLVASVMTRGSEQLSSLDIAERVESVGASLSTDAASDYFLLSLKTVTADFENILSLAAQLLRSPSFPETELALERRLMLQALRSQLEQPYIIALDQLRQAMYLDHPYALSGLGTEASVSQLDQIDLHRYHQTHFRPDNMVISLVGRITAASGLELAEQFFGDWQAPSTPLPLLQVPPLQSDPQQRVTAQSTQQSILMLGYLAPSMHHPDYAAIKLLSSYLGNGLSSRLFVELREKRGLAYEVSAFYPTRLQPSQFVVYMGTAPENTAIALEGLQQEVERLFTTQLPPHELQAAKNKLLGQYALGKQTNAQIAQIFGWYETLGIGLEFDTEFQSAIAAVSAEAAQLAAHRYLQHPYVSLVGPVAAVTPLQQSAVF